MSYFALSSIEADINRHGGQQVPAENPPKPYRGGKFPLDQSVIRALPIPGTEVISSRKYGMSLWGNTATIFTKLPNDENKTYFLKTYQTMSLGTSGRCMIEGEFESLKAMYAVSPELTAEPYSWGKYDQDEPETYFLLAQYREVGEQPPDPVKFTARLADMHNRSVSPTGKFGFHTTTCHARLAQVTDLWEESWSVLYQKQLAHMIQLDEEKHGIWPEFKHVCRLTIDKVIPRLLEPLQSGGRSIKPCLVHGDLWDENTATDMDTGEPFMFDASSFYAHNEYEIGNWRAPRHRLSNRVYVNNYKRNFPVSEPEAEWDDRNLLYSLRFDLGTAILIPGCNQRQAVKDGMTLLCEKYFPKELKKIPPGLLGLIESDEEEEEEEEGGEDEDEDEE